MKEDLSLLQRVERDLLCEARGSISACSAVTALRLYRQACQRLLETRCADGECDAVSISRFEDAINEIERLAW